MKTGSMFRRWSINGDFVALGLGGVPRYAKEVTLALDALIGDGHPLTERLSLDLVAPREPKDFALQNIPLRVVREFNKPRLPQFWVQLQLPRHVNGGLLSFCNLAPVANSRHIACIHDLHTMLKPESYGKGFRLAHRVILPMLGRRARRIATVSDLSRDHLVEHGVAPAEKITVTYSGADHAARWNPAEATLELGDRPYVVYIGRAEKYKNMELIWQIAPALDAMGLDVYVAGVMSDEALSTYGQETPQNFRMLGRISDDDLGKAFRSAVCFLTPSRIEGFGLMAIEAMTCDCPVVSSDAPFMPETCDDAALYAGPDDPDVWIAAIESLNKDHELRQTMIAKGHARAAQYTWRGIAEKYLRLMAEVDGIAPQ